MSPESVFINCPFTRDYAPLFEAMTFTVLACGFHPRSALERGDSGEVRMDKILRLIKSSLYSVHDLSATTLDLATGLPRFNMPFELGLTLRTSIPIRNAFPTLLDRIFRRMRETWVE